VNRLDGLAENEPFKRLADLRENLRAKKTTQRTGSENVATTRTVSGSTYDFSMSLTYHNIMAFELTVSPIDNTFPNSSFVWHLFYNADVVGTGFARLIVEGFPPDPVTGVRINRVYGMGTSPSDSVTYNVRVVIYSIGGVTFDVAQII
jgi:hypothetical protein